MVRRRQGLFVASLALMAALAGCAQPGMLPSASTVTSDFSALADFPDIDAQIARAKGQQTDFGLQVKTLPTPGRAKPITFLTYKALDNNLGSLLPIHLNTLEKAGSSQNVNVLTFADDEGPDNTYRYYVRQDSDAKTITSPYQSVKEADSGSPQALTGAMKWAFGGYPSRFRWLDINNHGGGYYGIAQDETSNSIMRIPDLARAIQTGSGGQKVDLLSFDACLMATVEVAYELRGAAKVMVASEDETLALGMNYDQTLQALAAQPQTDAEALGRELVVRSQRKGQDSILPGHNAPSTHKPTRGIYTISALDLSKADRVTQAVDGLATALLAALPAHKSEIVMSLKAVQPFYVTANGGNDFEHRDLNEVADQLRERVQDARVQAACAALKDTLFNRGGVILFARSARQENKVPRGLSVYLPLDGNVDTIYKDTSFARATHWDEFLAALK